MQRPGFRSDNVWQISRESPGAGGGRGPPRVRDHTHARTVVLRLSQWRLGSRGGSHFNARTASLLRAPRALWVVPPSVAPGGAGGCYCLSGSLQRSDIGLGFICRPSTRNFGALAGGRFRAYWLRAVGLIIIIIIIIMNILGA